MRNVERAKSEERTEKVEEEGESYRKVKREYNKMCEKKKKENDRWVEMTRKAKTGVSMGGSN